MCYQLQTTDTLNRPERTERPDTNQYWEHDGVSVSYDAQMGATLIPAKFDLSHLQDLHLRTCTNSVQALKLYGNGFYGVDLQK